MLQAPRGTQDIYGEEMKIWRYIENNVRQITDVYGYSEIRVPIFEHTELFLRGVGDTTDVVQKEMYTFEDKGGRSLSLRPEQTAGTARAFIERGMHNQPQPTKLFYIGPNFRYERPQEGRFRQHTQFGIEAFGAGGFGAEAEVISLGWELLSALGLDVTVNLNSIGCADCRKIYHERLKKFLGEQFEGLCGVCKQRFEKNPLRVLDCKMLSCKDLLEHAPSVLDSLDEACLAHFNGLQELLTRMKIPFVINPKIVRGLDYYTRTVFEFIKDGLTVIGGGRYDTLVEQVGGTATPAVGFGMGMERLVLLLQKQGSLAQICDAPQIFIGHMGDEGFAKAQELTHALRRAGIRAESDLIGRGVKAQMKYANKLNARYTMILGETEIAENAANIKNMETSEQERVQLAELAEFGGFRACTK
ncbi:MAG: histidine--tRNA ligase [Defluviitaleaceae bacterium]|nr:histidine--tRNA ligase [Defluviitaleaceae bacterium]